VLASHAERGVHLHLALPMGHAVSGREREPAFYGMPATAFFGERHGHAHITAVSTHRTMFCAICRMLCGCAESAPPARLRPPCALGRSGKWHGSGR